ncbi:MAG TPA: septum formation initiator [Micromonosporaceae bacterium]|nr:septum formation initiator [Micromonosporaceae bacterium]
MRRTAAAVAWLAAAAAATAAGVAAVTLIGHGLVGPEPDDPYSEREVLAALSAAPTAVPSGGPAGTPSPSPSAAPAAATLLLSPGGTVTARCVGGEVRLEFWSPLPGYTVDEVDDDRVTFARGEDEVEARVRCGAGGTPVLEVKRD